jgi:hypothetical protein
MQSGSSQIRNTERVRLESTGRQNADATRRGTPHWVAKEGNVTMQPEARSGRMEAVAPHPLAELLECPPATGDLLNGSAQSIAFDAGEIVFRQYEACKGLYVVVSGQLLRRTERLRTRLTLGPARPGDLVELAAALGDCNHTYTLSAQDSGSMLLLPIEALNQAFQSYPLLRMHLLEELAREVSRAYNTCCMNRTMHTRGRSSMTSPA